MINILIYYDDFPTKTEVSQIFKTLIENKEQSYDKTFIFNPLIEDISCYLEKGSKNENSSTTQIIIEILMVYFNNIGFDSEFWLEKHKISEILVRLLKEQNKIINIYGIKLLKNILEISPHCISSKILTQELCNNLIEILKENFKKKNMLSSCLMSFFESISQNQIFILNIIMKYSYDFFNANKEDFKNILLRYEKKPLPKKQLLNFMNINTFTETSFKNNDYFFDQDIQEPENCKENIFSDNLLSNELVFGNYLQDNDNEMLVKQNEDFSIERSDNYRLNFLNKKRYKEKDLEDEGLCDKINEQIQKISKAYKKGRIKENDELDLELDEEQKNDSYF